MYLTDAQRSIVFQAIGAATVCWDGLEHAGAFKPSEAAIIADKLCDKIDGWLEAAYAGTPATT